MNNIPQILTAASFGACLLFFSAGTITLFEERSYDCTYLYCIHLAEELMKKLSNFMCAPPDRKLHALQKIVQFG